MVRISGGSPVGILTTPTSLSRFGHWKKRQRCLSPRRGASLVAFVVFVVTLSCVMSFAQDAASGLPNFSTQISGFYDFVDPASSNIFISLPLRSKSGPIPFSSSLTGSSHIYTVVGNFELPSPMSTTVDPSVSVTSSINYSYVCNGNNDTIFSNFVVNDSA